MKRIHRRLLWVFTPLAVLFLLVLSMATCVSMPPGKKDIAKVFSRQPPTYRTYEALGRKIFAVEVGPEDGPLVILLHGSPGDWSNFLGLMADPALRAKARLVSVDRPGYGQSIAGGIETSLARQAAVLVPILESNQSGRPAILVGYSLGGPVAVRAAIDYPSLVGGLVLVAPSIDPELEKDLWFAKVSRWRIVSWIIPKPFKDADDEIRPLKAELQAMLPHWGDIRVPVTVLQGEEDSLVPPANADFAKRMLTAAPVDIQLIPGVGHAIAWESTAQIRDAILAQLGSR